MKRIAGLERGARFFFLEFEHAGGAIRATHDAARSSASAALRVVDRTCRRARRWCRRRSWRPTRAVAVRPSYALPGTEPRNRLVAGPSARRPGPSGGGGELGPRRRAPLLLVLVEQVLAVIQRPASTYHGIATSLPSSVPLATSAGKCSFRRPGVLLEIEEEANRGCRDTHVDAETRRYRRRRHRAAAVRTASFSLDDVGEVTT